MRRRQRYKVEEAAKLLLFVTRVQSHWRALQARRAFKQLQDQAKQRLFLTRQKRHERLGKTAKEAIYISDIGEEPEH